MLSLFTDTLCPSWSTCLLSTCVKVIVVIFPVIVAILYLTNWQNTSPDTGAVNMPQTLPPPMPSMNDEPEMHLMLYIKRVGDQEGLRIVEDVAADCHKLGLHLGLKEALVKSESQMTQEEKCEKIISKWLAGRGKHPITWKTFIDTLKIVPLRRLARELEMLLLQ